MAGPQAWNFTIDDASPVFSYEPYSEGPDPSSGWQFLTGDDCVDAQNSTGLPTNKTTHITSMKGASVSLEFFGSGIVLYGSANCSYSITYDKKSQTIPHTPEGVLFFTSKSNDDLGNHNITLTASPENPYERLSFTGAILISQVNSTQSTPSILEQHSQNSMFQYRGTWKDKKAEEKLPSDPDSTFRATTALGDLAQLTFSTRAVAVYGPTNASSGLYSVLSNDTLFILNATTVKPSSDTLLFYQDGMDRFKNSTLQITNLESGQLLAVSRVEFYNFDTGVVRTVSDSSKKDKDKTTDSNAPDAGLIITAIFGTLLVIAMIFVMFWWLRKRMNFEHLVDALHLRKVLARCPRWLTRRKGVTLTPFRMPDVESINREKRSIIRDSSQSNEPQPLQVSAAQSGRSIPTQDQSTLERMLRMIARSMDPSPPPNGSSHESMGPPPYREP